MADRYCVEHTNRAAQRGSLNALPDDPNQVKPETAASSMSTSNTTDGRSPGAVHASKDAAKSGMGGAKHK